MRGWGIQSRCDSFKGSYYWRMCVRRRIWALKSYDSKIIIWKEVEADNWKPWMWPWMISFFGKYGLEIEKLQNQNISFALTSESCPCSWWTKGTLSRWRALLINLEDMDGRHLQSIISKPTKTQERKGTSYISQVVCWIRVIKETSQVPWSLVGRGWHDDGKLPGDGVLNVMLEQSSWGSGSLWEMLYPHGRLQEACPEQHLFEIPL